MHVTNDIARAVSIPLGTMEHSWAQAVRDGANMVAAMAAASLDAQAPISIVAEMLERGVEGLNQLGAVGRTYSELHSRLSAVARMSGLDPKMYGQSYVPPSMVVELDQHRKAA